MFGLSKKYTFENGSADGVTHRHVDDPKRGAVRLDHCD